jgi:hypothetical protein
MKKEQKQQVSTKPSNVLYTLLGVVASNQVNELIKQGWEFTLHFGDNRTWCDIIEQPCWEADFTRKKDNGLWDNHESGYGNSPDLAIEKAYNNIINGVRLMKSS